MSMSDVTVDKARNWIVVLKKILNQSDVGREAERAPQKTHEKTSTLVGKLLDALVLGVRDGKGESSLLTY